MLRTVCAAGIVAMLSACTSIFDAMNRRPAELLPIYAEKDSDREIEMVAVSLSAEKRAVLVGVGSHSGKFCAEPPPEVAKAFDIDRTDALSLNSQLSAEKKAEIKAEQREAVKEALSVIAQRTVLLDIYRTGTYTLCQFFLNDAMTAKDLTVSFDKLTDGVLRAYSDSANAIAAESVARTTSQASSAKPAAASPASQAVAPGVTVTVTPAPSAELAKEPANGANRDKKDAPQK